MAEWFKAAVLKTVEPRSGFRGFKSYSLRQEKAFSVQQTAITLRTRSVLVFWLRLRADC
jgi:hypothetical protein